MSKSRRANAVIFGFDFQVNAAIVLMLENIQELDSLKLEGNYEDIEITLDNGEYILAQAKAVEKSSVDFQNVRQNLKKALISLSEGAHKVNARQLILITNSPNEFHSAKTPNEKCVDFALSKWEDYVQELKLDNADEETQRCLVQIVLYNIVKNRMTINKVKRGVNL